MDEEKGAVLRFTQFIRPDGRRIPVTIEVPAEVGALAKELTDVGWALEIEMLSTGEVSMEVCGLGEALVTEICDNGPEVPPTVVRLIRKAHQRWTELKCLPVLS